MGVRGLQSFLENNCPDACYFVNIRNLAHEYRNGTGRKPVIVVDGSSCLRYLYGELEWIYGGQFKEFEENAIKFVNSFKALDIELVFFFDGPTENRKRDEWVTRRHKTLIDVYNIYDLLKNGRKAGQELMQIPACLNLFMSKVFKDICGCKVYSTMRECDEEIAEYAFKNKCFAILSQDTDFVIYEGGLYYLSVKSLNLQSMRTLLYNRQALARHLEIHALHLPLLASLVGNDIVPSDALQYFHNRICRGRRIPKILIPAVARFVSRYPADTYRLSNILKEISTIVFGTDGKEQLLRCSIDSYSFGKEPVIESNNAKWKEILKVARTLQACHELPSIICSIAFGLPYELSTSMEDFRENDLPASAFIMKPMRSRLYGVIFHENPKKESVEEWCMSGDYSLRAPETVEVIRLRSSDIHPGLLSLWNKENANNSGLQDKKWALFAWIVSDKLSGSSLKNLPAHLVIPTAALFFLHQEVSSSLLSEMEINAFIAQAVVLSSWTTESLSRIQAGFPKSRIIRISVLILKICQLLIQAMGCCGYPVDVVSILPNKFFDGKLFHMKYNDTKKGMRPLYLVNNEVSFFEQFQQMKASIYNTQLS